ncbi:MAG: Rpn family recombination-promoting nuclease/putative transposase [Ruminococcus flavefaciens]|nr:Rpn family recombination-promoting nuclease/putative transposase [Ruminococcus flavefaciens]
MAEIIAASHDVMFKALFVSNKDILRAFLRDVLDLPLTEKDKVDILNPELIPESSDGKLSRLDIHVEMADRRFNIEMQARKSGFSAERVLYYWAKMFDDKVESGSKYEQLEQTFSVNILGFRYLDCKEYHSSYSILEDKRYEKLTDKLSIYIFELPKVPKEIISGDTKQQWMELIRADSEEALEMVRTTSTSPEIQKGIEKIYELNADTILREQIRQRDKAIRDYENDIAVAEERGIAKGRAEGEAKGRVEERADAIKNLMLSLKIDEIKAKELLGLA